MTSPPGLTLNVFAQRHSHLGGKAAIVLAGQLREELVLSAVDVGAHRDPFRGRGFLLRHKRS